MTIQSSPHYQPRYDTLPRMVTAVPREIAFGELIAAHNHPWVQLLYASEGVMRVRTELGVWIIPPRRALLIPPGVVHELTMLSRVNQRTLYIDTHAAGSLVGANCKVLEVSPLLRELIVALSIEPVDYPAGSRGEALARLILSELAAMETVPIAVPWPRDRRLQAVCTDIMDHPGNQRHLADYASDTGASARTLIRLFPKETGLPYRQWVQQVHLAHAFEMLARGTSVGIVARTLGYASPSAFTVVDVELAGVNRSIQDSVRSWPVAEVRQPSIYGISCSDGKQGFCQTHLAKHARFQSKLGGHGLRNRQALAGSAQVAETERVNANGLTRNGQAVWKIWW